MTSLAQRGGGGEKLTACISTLVRSHPYRYYGTDGAEFPGDRTVITRRVDGVTIGKTKTDVPANGDSAKILGRFYNVSPDELAFSRSHRREI